MTLNSLTWGPHTLSMGLAAHLSSALGAQSFLEQQGRSLQLSCCCAFAWPWALLG